MVIETKEVMLTPQMAKELLDTVKINRTVSKETVKAYASDMLAGRWYDNGVPIIVDDRGELRDGQHRCAAVIASGISIPCEIKTVDTLNAVAYDLNRTRSTKDYIRIGGETGQHMQSNMAIASVTFLLGYANNKRKLSKFEVIETMRKLDSDIKYIYSLFAKTQRGITKGAAFAAFITALENGYSKDRIDRAAYVLKSGVMKDSLDETIIRLREYLLCRQKNSGYSETVDIYRAVLHALWCYDKNRTIHRLIVPEIDRYPLPEVVKNDSKA